MILSTFQEMLCILKVVRYTYACRLHFAHVNYIRLLQAIRNVIMIALQWLFSFREFRGPISPNVYCKW